MPERLLTKNRSVQAARSKHAAELERHIMRLSMLAPLMGLMMTSLSVRAAVPPDTVCSPAASAAQRLRSAGNLLAARARLSTCVSSGCATQLRDECARQLAAMDAEIPSIVVEAMDEASNSVTDARATMDGAPLLEQLDTKEIPVNPGEHRLALESPGFRRAEVTFVTREGQKRLRVMVFLTAGSTPAPSPSTAPPAASAPVGGDEARSLGKGRKIGLGLAYAGIGGLAVGTIWSIMSKATYDHALATECGGDPNRCSAPGIADGHSARNKAAIATVGFVSAGVLLAAGAAVFFTSPKHDQVAVAPAFEPGGGGLTVVGQW